MQCLLSIFFCFTGMKIGEEVVSLNPGCADSHRWYVWSESQLFWSNYVADRFVLVREVFPAAVFKQMNEAYFKM